MADNIVKAFSPTSGVVNALSFLSAVILLSNDLESPNPTKSKSDLIFDTFDFQESGDMSLDEITILLLSVCRACNVVTGGGADPSDETMEQVRNDNILVICITARTIFTNTTELLHMSLTFSCSSLSSCTSQPTRK